MSCTPCVIQSLSLSNPQQSNYSFAISNQFRQGQLLGRIDSAGSVVGIAQTTFNGIDAFIQWTKRGPMPPDMYAAAEWSPDSQSAFSFKMLKGMETSVQYFKSYGKRFGVGTELKYTFPLRKTLSGFNFRYKSSDKLTIVTGEVCSNTDFKVDVLRKLRPMASIVAEVEHKQEQGLMNFKIGSQVNFVGQGMVRVQVDPDLRVKAMASSPIGRGNAMLQFVCQWDPKTKAFRQGIDVKMQGAVPTMA
mmetsp:Transcript_51123/g.83991  ORF Transcript_51123/g.83991 Transcript_51123/m.83991 type:complete len:247 (-) Transcript_51123:1069-1809(-)